MKNTNTHTTREGWLRAAIGEVSPLFDKLGRPLPDKIRCAIAFTSTGKRGQMTGECWHPDASSDKHYEIIIRADLFDPVEVLSELIHQLIHALLPLSVKHGKAFRDLALRIGLEGNMRHTHPNPILRDYLQNIAANLGALPHAKLDFAGASDVPKKQGVRYLKAECPAACGYTIRITAKWAKAGLPFCPIDNDHGVLVCDLPDEIDDAPPIISEPI